MTSLTSIDIEDTSYLNYITVKFFPALIQWQKEQRQRRQNKLEQERELKKDEEQVTFYYYIRSRS
jgi:hypothetical protein